MGAYAVDATELQYVDGRLQHSEAQARAALSALTTTAEQLLDGRWSSPAAAAFRVGWADWLAAAHDALTALTGLGHAVGLAGVGYADTDDEVQAAVTGTRA
jgi:WXG100 family type VII secretion target